MRTNTRLLEIENITILLQYLYMSEEHSVIINNGLTDIEIYMRDDCKFRAKNMAFPNLPDMDYTETMTVSCMLGIIGYLKKVSAIAFPHRFANRWEEIKEITLHNLYINKKRILSPH